MRGKQTDGNTPEILIPLYCKWLKRIEIKSVSIDELQIMCKKAPVKQFLQPTLIFGPHIVQRHGPPSLFPLFIWSRIMAYITLLMILVVIGRFKLYHCQHDYLNKPSLLRLATHTQVICWLVAEFPANSTAPSLLQIVCQTKFLKLWICHFNWQSVITMCLIKFSLSSF